MILRAVAALPVAAILGPGLAAPFVVVGPLAAQAPTASEWATLAQRVEVDMTAADGSAEVRIELEIGPAEAGAPVPAGEPVGFELLGFAGAGVDEVVLDGERRLVLWPATGSRRVVMVEPPFEPDGDTLAMTFAYRVEDVVEGATVGPALHARIPVLTGPPARTGSGGEVFAARLAVPEAWAVTEGFPSGLRPAEAGGYAVSLTVAPSVIGFRARTDGAWRPGFPLLVDALTLAILLVFVGLGWRHLRSFAA